MKSDRNDTMFPTLHLLSEVTSQPYKQAQLGFLQGKMRQSGNSIPVLKHKTRRCWLPYVQTDRDFDSESTRQSHYARDENDKRCGLIFCFTCMPDQLLSPQHGGIDHYAVLKTKLE